MQPQGDNGSQRVTTDEQPADALVAAHAVAVAALVLPRTGDRHEFRHQHHLALERGLPLRQLNRQLHRQRRRMLG